MIESREPFNAVKLMPVEPDQLVQVCILQPKDPDVGRLGVYKGAQCQHSMLAVVALASGLQLAMCTPSLSLLLLGCEQYRDVLCATGTSPLPEPL